MKQIITLVVGFLLVLLNVSAQEVYSDAPVVPIEVAMRGRQAVTDFLLKEINRVYVSYSGRSVVGDSGINNRNIDLPELEHLGYTHRGQFTELSDALSRISFSGNVIETPQRQYEIQVNLYFFTGDNKMALSGAGYLQVRKNSDGTLSADKFEPWISINSQIQIKADDVQEAKWLGADWGQEEHLQVIENVDGTRGFLLPVRLLERGFVVAADRSGEVVGWDMVTMTILHGKDLFARLGQLHSSEVRVVRDQEAVDTTIEQFYHSEGKVYGRFPLLDVVTGGRKEWININVPIWGTPKTISPTQMFVTPVYVDNPSVIGLVPGTRYEVKRSENGFFPLVLPKGGYHIEFTFPQVWDWEVDDNGKG